MGFLDYAGLQYLWDKLKEKFAPKSHNHDDRYYTETEMDAKLNGKAESIVLASDANLNNATTPGFYSCGGGNSIANKPSGTDAIGLIVTHNASGAYYTQILTTSSNSNTYRRTCLNGTWSKWTQDKYTDTNTWRGIQNNLTSDSKTDSLSAAQGKALKTLVDGKAANGHKHTKDQVGLSSVDNTADKDKTVASAAKLTTARTVSGGSDITLSFNYDGSGNSTANIGFYSCKHFVGNTNNYPFHRFAKLDNLTSAYADRTMLVYITQDYNGGGFGICRLSLRTNNSSSASTVEAKWLVRSGLSTDFVQVAIYNVYGKTYADAFIKINGTYGSTTISALESGRRGTKCRTWTLVDSNEVDGTTATDKKTSSECWKTIAEAGVAIHEQEYSSSASAIDKGYVASADSANTSSSCTGNSASATKLTSSAGSAIQPVYFKDGKPVVIGYTVAKSVPANAKFTDTNTWRGVQNNLTSDSTGQSLSAAQGKALKGLVDGKADKEHTHNYAGSGSAGGAANSANILNSRGTVAPQTGRTQNYGDVYAYKTTSGDSSKGAPTTHTATIGFGRGSAGTVEICGEWTGGKGLWSRALRDYQDSWYDWQRIYTENYHPNADYASSAGAVAWNKVSGKPSTYPPSSHSHAYIPSAGGDATGYINFNQTSTGIAWTCANGDVYHLRPYSSNNVFQLTRQNPNSKIGEYGVLNITGDGDIFFGQPGHADAFPMLGTVATGSNYIRFGDGTQICWGAITYNYQSASEINLPVPFVDTSYSVSGLLSIHSGVEKIIRFGNKSASSFRITIQNGVSSQLDWMAIGRWC